MMKDKLFILSFVLFLVCYMQAQNSVINSSIYPGVILSQDDNGYTIQYSIGKHSICLDTVYTANDKFIFSSIDFYDDFYERLDVPGLPALPFFGCDLRIPELDENMISVKLLDIHYYNEFLPYDFVPTQQYTDSVLNTLYFDKSYYISEDAEFYGKEFDWNIYMRPRSVGLNFTIYPFHYQPSKRCLTIVTSATYRIDVKSSDKNIDNHLLNFLYDNNILAYSFFDNYVDVDYDFSSEFVFHQLIDNVRYLIISSDNFKYSNALQEFIKFKTFCGYDVDVEFVNNISSKDIISFLEDYYKRYNDLLYVLLVGSPDLIPFSAGNEDDKSNPPTDLDYVRLPSLNTKSWNFNYSYYLGRWPIENTNQLEYLVKKSIKNEELLGQYSPSHVSIFSGSGHHETYLYNNAKGLDKIIKSVPRLSVSLFDGRDKYVGSKELSDELEGLNGIETWMFVYFGHGNTTLIGPPYYWYAFDINRISNTRLNFQPFGFAFSCLIGNVFSPYNFTTAWLTEENGGVTMLSSTTISYDPPNRYYSRNTFSLLKNNKNMPIGAFIYDGKEKFYSKCKTEPRWRTIRRFNLFGDPSLYIYGIDWSKGIPHLSAPVDDVADYNMSESKEFSKVPIDLPEIDNSTIVKLFNLDGVCVYEGDYGNIRYIQQQQGIYVLHIYKESEFEIHKVLIQ